jgi:5-methylcytosine-specific restriction protein A
VQWREIRAAVLKRDPICTSCLVNKSTDADHYVARAKGGSDDLSNLRGMCHSCHSRKTAKQDAGFGNARVHA